MHNLKRRLCFWIVYLQSVYSACPFELGRKKYQKIAIMYDCTGLSTKCTVIKTGFKNFRTGTEAKFRPSVDALIRAYLTSSAGCHSSLIT